MLYLWTREIGRQTADKAGQITLQKSLLFRYLFEILENKRLIYRRLDVWVQYPVSPLKSSFWAAFLFLWRATPPMLWNENGSVFLVFIEFFERRDARVVEEARLESVYTPKVYRGFESRSLRWIWNLVKTSRSLAKSSFHRSKCLVFLVLFSCISFSFLYICARYFFWDITFL